MTTKTQPGNIPSASGRLAPLTPSQSIFHDHSSPPLAAVPWQQYPGSSTLAVVTTIDRFCLFSFFLDTYNDGAWTFLGYNKMPPFKVHLTNIHTHVTTTPIKTRTLPPPQNDPTWLHRQPFSLSPNNHGGDSYR